MLPCINQIGEGWWGGVSAGPQEPGAVDGHTDHLRAHRDQAQPGLLQLPLQNAGLRGSTARGQRSVDICSDIYSFYSKDVYFSWLLIIAPIFTPSFFDTEVFFLWGIFHSHAVIVDIFWLKTMKRVCTHVCYKNKKNIIICHTLVLEKISKPVHAVFHLYFLQKCKLMQAPVPVELSLF